MSLDFGPGLIRWNRYIYVKLLSMRIRLFHVAFPQGKHSKDLCVGDCGVAWFIHVEIKAAPWVSNVSLPLTQH